MSKASKVYELERSLKLGELNMDSISSFNKIECLFSLQSCRSVHRESALFPFKEVE